MKKTIADKENIDLNSCYFPEETIPVEFMGDDCLEKKKSKPVNMYLISDDFILLLMGDTAIKVSEQFKDKGKDIKALLEDTIIRDYHKM